jgi:hypothetical protein
VDDDITARLGVLIGDERAMTSMTRMVTAVECMLTFPFISSCLMCACVVWCI